MSNDIFGSNKAVEEEVDSDFLGGGSYLLDSDLYDATISAAYITESASSDSKALTTVFKVGKKEVSFTTWFTNRKGELTYKDKNGKVRNSMGYNSINAMTLLLLGTPFIELSDDFEEKKVNIYDYDAKKPVPTSVQCLASLHGTKCKILVQKRLVNKQKKNEQTGKYEDIADSKEENVLIKVFDEDKVVTISELEIFIKSKGASLLQAIEKDQVLIALSKCPEMDPESSYVGKWLASNKGVTYDARTIKSNDSSSTSSSGSDSGLTEEDETLF